MGSGSLGLNLLRGALLLLAAFIILPGCGLYDNSSTPYYPVGLPVPVALDNLTALEGSQVELDGSSSYDPDGQIVRYRWEQQRWNEPAVDIVNANSAIAHFTAPSVKADSYLQFNFWVLDDQWNEQVANIPVLILNLPEPMGGLTAVGGNGSIEVSWTLLRDAISYDFCVAPSNFTTWIECEAAPNRQHFSASQSPFSVTGLSAGSYSLIAVPLNGNGAGVASGVVSAVVN